MIESTVAVMSGGKPAPGTEATRVRGGHFVINRHAVVEQCGPEPRREGEGVGQHRDDGVRHEPQGVGGFELALGEGLDGRGEGDHEHQDHGGHEQQPPKVGEHRAPECDRESAHEGLV
jgi:hypothetical protein